MKQQRLCQAKAIYDYVPDDMSKGEIHLTFVANEVFFFFFFFFFF